MILESSARIQQRNCLIQRSFSCRSGSLGRLPKCRSFELAPTTNKCNLNEERVPTELPLPIQITFFGRRRELKGPAGCVGIAEIDLSDFRHFEGEFSSKISKPSRSHRRNSAHFADRSNIQQGRP